MKNKIPKRVLLSIICQLLIPIVVRAGGTVMTTSDSSGDHTYNYGSEIVIDGSGMVTLTTSVDNGTVTLNASDYICSPGVSLITGSPSGIGTATETAVFQFASSCVGKINSITLNPPQHVGSDGTTNCNTTRGGVPFIVCIPKPVVSGTTTEFGDHIPFSLGRGFLFYDGVNVVGLDDLTQVNIKQTIRSSSDFTNLNGTDDPTGTAVALNTGGLYVTDTGWDWFVPTVGGDRDKQMFAKATWFKLIIDSTIYSYSEVGWAERDFRLLLKRTSGNLPLGNCELDWGYTWDNNNVKWPNAAAGGLPARPATINSAVLKNLGHGEFSGVYGGAPVP